MKNLEVEKIPSPGSVRDIENSFSEMVARTASMNLKREKGNASLENLIVEELAMKSFTLNVFFLSALSYLIMTMVRGKGSLPYWVQIPTTLMYASMVICVRLYGHDPKY